MNFCLIFGRNYVLFTAIHFQKNVEKTCKSVHQSAPPVLYKCIIDFFALMPHQIHVLSFHPCYPNILSRPLLCAINRLTSFNYSGKFPLWTQKKKTAKKEFFFFFLMLCPPFPLTSSFLSLSHHFLCISSISFHHSPPPITPLPHHHRHHHHHHCPTIPVSTVWRSAPRNETRSYRFLITTALAAILRATTAITITKTTTYREGKLQLKYHC